MSLCTTQKAVGDSTMEKSDPLHLQVERIDKLFKQECPGSNVQEYFDNAEQPTILAIIDVLASTGRSSPLNSRTFNKLPKIWINGDPILDRVSSKIAEYLIDKMGLPPARHLIVRLDNDRYRKSYLSFYRVTQEQQYDNGVSSHINLETGQNVVRNFLQLEETELRPYMPESNVVKSRNY